MGIKVKVKGQWVDYNVAANSTGPFHITIPRNSGQGEIWDQDDNGIFFCFVSLDGLRENFSVFSFLNYTKENVFIDISAHKNKLLITTSSPVEQDVDAIVFYNTIPTKNDMVLIGGITDLQELEMIQKIREDIPIAKDSEGYLQISAIPKMTHVSFKKEETSESEKEKGYITKVTINYDLENNTSGLDTIYFNGSDYPVLVIDTDGKECAVDWEGFVEVE